MVICNIFQVPYIFFNIASMPSSKACYKVSDSKSTNRPQHTKNFLNVSKDRSKNKMWQTLKGSRVSRLYDTSEGAASFHSKTIVIQLSRDRLVAVTRVSRGNLMSPLNKHSWCHSPICSFDFELYTPFCR